MDLQDLFIQAANTKTAVSLRLDYAGWGKEPIEITFHPYIMGADTYQFDYVWGFNPNSLQFERILLHFIKSARLLKDHFEVRPNTVYYYAIGEEMFSLVPEMYGDPVRVYNESHIVGPEDLK